MSLPERSKSNVLIFDGDCKMCRSSVEWIRRRDPDGLIETLPYQDLSVSARFPGIPPEDLRLAIQLISLEAGRLEGARAVEEILNLIPSTRRVGPLFRIPGVRWLAQRTYEIVARNRRRFGCSDHCCW